MIAHTLVNLHLLPSGDTLEATQAEFGGEIPPVYWLQENDTEQQQQPYGIQAVLGEPELGCYSNTQQDSSNKTSSSPTTTEYQGQVVVFTRGECTFIEKAQYAQRSGAVGMIVINTEGDCLSTMAGSDESLTIFSIYVPSHNGSTLLSSLPINIAFSAPTQQASATGLRDCAKTVMTADPSSICLGFLAVFLVVVCSWYSAEPERQAQQARLQGRPTPASVKESLRQVHIKASTTILFFVLILSRFVCII